MGSPGNSLLRHNLHNRYDGRDAPQFSSVFGTEGYRFESCRVYLAGLLPVENGPPDYQTPSVSLTHGHFPRPKIPWRSRCLTREVLWDITRSMLTVSWVDNFRDNLRAAMREKGMSQSALARETGVQQPTISLILSGKMEPSVTMCETLAMAVGLRADLSFIPPAAKAS